MPHRVFAAVYMWGSGFMAALGLVIASVNRAPPALLFLIGGFVSFGLCAGICHLLVSCRETKPPVSDVIRGEP